MTVDEAKEQGAVGLFGDKYGEHVKVYTMGTFSKEIAAAPMPATQATWATSRSRRKRPPAPACAG